MSSLDHPESTAAPGHLQPFGDPLLAVLENISVSSAHQVAARPYSCATWPRAAKSSRGLWARGMDGTRRLPTTPPSVPHRSSSLLSFGDTPLPSRDPSSPQPVTKPTEPSTIACGGKVRNEGTASLSLLPLPCVFLQISHIRGVSGSDGFRQTLTNVRRSHPTPMTPPRLGPSPTR